MTEGIIWISVSIFTGIFCLVVSIILDNDRKKRSADLDRDIERLLNNKL